jgi:hypothetical protein
MLPDDQLDALLRDAKPSAPAGFEDRVMSRVRRPQFLMFAAASVVVLAMAGVGILSSFRGSSHLRIESGWFRGGQPIAEGATVAGPVDLTSGDRHASISAGVRVARAALGLNAGNATLRGDNIVVETTPARITTLTPDAEVEVEMNAKKSGAAIAAAGAAVLTVYVVHGSARVEPAANEPIEQTTLLAQGDRALVSARRPPAVLRASHPQVSSAGERTSDEHGAVALRTSQNPAAIQPARESDQPPAPGEATLAGSLDKEVIRTGIKSIIPRVGECYNDGLQKNPKLGGRIVVKFVIRTKDRKGRIDEAEIDPENDDLQSPLVEQCMLNAIAEIEFPAPEGGGEVHVTYPFVLAAQDPDKR